MSRVVKMIPVFVEFIPSDLKSGELYVSLTYSVTAHLCACGCGEKVVLPLHPEQWRFTYDGASISIFPSIGNISTNCNSHYWIENNRIKWGSLISKDQAIRGIARDRGDLAGHGKVPIVQQLPPAVARNGLLVEILRRLFSKNKPE